MGVLPWTQVWLEGGLFPCFGRAQDTGRDWGCICIILLALLCCCYHYQKSRPQGAASPLGWEFSTKTHTRDLGLSPSEESSGDAQPETAMLSYSEFKSVEPHPAEREKAHQVLGRLSPGLLWWWMTDTLTHSICSPE